MDFSRTGQHSGLEECYLMISLCPFLAARCRGVV